MTEQEWAAFLLEVNHAFRGEPVGGIDPDGQAREATWRAHLGETEYGHARRAVALLVEDGQVWMPVPGEVRAALRRLTPAPPPFAVVLQVVLSELARAQRMGGRSAEALLAAVTAVAGRCGEGAARWTQARGFTLRDEATEGDHAGVVRHRLEAEYSTFAAQAEEDDRRELAIGRAERAALGQGTGGPKRLDPMAALGAGS